MDAVDRLLNGTETITQNQSNNIITYEKFIEQQQTQQIKENQNNNNNLTIKELNSLKQNGGNENKDDNFKITTKISQIYKVKFPIPDRIKETEVDYQHLLVHELAYDFSVYIHKKVAKFPQYEKFVLQEDIRKSVDNLLDEIELFEITGMVSHIYAADQAKRRILRKLRMAHDLRYTAMNNNSLLYCAIELSKIGKLIGGIIKTKKEEKLKK